jgi:hypothetical protein
MLHFRHGSGMPIAGLPANADIRSYSKQTKCLVGTTFFATLFIGTFCLNGNEHIEDLPWVAQPIKKFLTFIWIPKVPSPCSQKPAAEPYTEPFQFALHNVGQCFWYPFKYYFHIYPKWCSPLRIFNQNYMYFFLLCMLHIVPISLLIW